MGAESVGVAVEVEDDGSVQEPVEHGGCDGGVAQDFVVRWAIRWSQTPGIGRSQAPCPPQLVRVHVSTVLRKLRVKNRKSAFDILRGK